MCYLRSQPRKHTKKKIDLITFSEHRQRTTYRPKEIHKRKNAIDLGKLTGIVPELLEFGAPNSDREVDDVVGVAIGRRRAAIGGGEHEGEVVGFARVVGVVLRGGEVDAGAPLEGGEEGRRDAGPDPGRDAVQLLVGDVRTQRVHYSRLNGLDRTQGSILLGLFSSRRW